MESDKTHRDSFDHSRHSDHFHGFSYLHKEFGAGGLRAGKQAFGHAAYRQAGRAHLLGE